MKFSKTNFQLILSGFLASFLVVSGCKKADPPPPDQSQRLVHSGIGLLSEARWNLAAAAGGNKILFAGGTYTDDSNNDICSKTVDIYDVVTNRWSTAELSVGREGLAGASAGNKIVFAGGIRTEGVGGVTDAVDIYDISTGAWTTAQLSVARQNLTAAAAGNKIVFAGGNLDFTHEYSKSVDIYDVVTGAWVTAELSEARHYLAAASCGNKIFFGGGLNGAASKTVDIYDVVNGDWTTAELSRARGFLAAASIGNKILFAGGIDPDPAADHLAISKNVDIYDQSTGAWTIATLSQGSDIPTATGLGNKILFAGGINFSTFDYSDAVDIYDVVTGIWETSRLSVARSGMASAGAGNKILVAGGVGTAAEIDLKTVDFFTLKN